MPTASRVKELVYALAKAQQKYPTIEIFAVCQMSNHLHLCVRDGEGQLSEFMQAFLSPFAKALNRIDKIRGPVFDRRFTAIPVVDAGALIRRIMYAVANPVSAGLVRSWKQWSGLVGWYGDLAPMTVTVFHEHRFNRAREDAGPIGVLDRREYEETVTLKMTPFEGIEPEAVCRDITRRETNARARHRRVVGMARVLRHTPLHRPHWSKLRRRPRCLWTCLAAKKAFENAWFVFLNAYREASARFRGGELTVPFPLPSHRPPTQAR